MDGSGGTTKVPSLPPPMPKDPPAFPDLYGKRREVTRIQMLEREIGFLEEELKFVEGLHAASQPCKEVADFVTMNSDPLIPTTTRAHKSWCFWKWFCMSPCLKFSWPCCISCTPHIGKCCCCGRHRYRSCISCSCPKCSCCSCEASQCCKMPSCSSRCCACECHPFSRRLSNCCVMCYHKCLRVDLCSCCKGYSCYHCCSCY